MTDEETLAHESRKALIRQKAYRDANRLIVSAGLVLAAVGVPCHAPEFRALAAALRAVNHAGGIGTPKPVFGPGKEAVRAYPPQSGRRFRRTAP